MAPELKTVPLQSRMNASPFWIMLLLSSTAVGHEMIEAGRRQSEDGAFNKVMRLCRS